MDRSEFEIVSQYQKITGKSVPTGFIDMLHVLTHSDMLPLVRDYVHQKESIDLCYKKTSFTMRESFLVPMN